MKIAIDIGGCISKYPKEFRELIYSLISCKSDIFIITDMHEKSEVLKMLKDNDFGDIPEKNVICADYKTHGEFCKAVILRDLKIDVFIDDFGAYLAWDSSFGPAPLRLLIMPDPYKPYWNEKWKVNVESDFGRRVYKEIK